MDVQIAYRKGALLATCFAAALLCAPAAHAVTIGAPLDQQANVQGGCPAVVFWVVPPPPPSCTLLGNDPAGGWTSQVPRGNWVIHTGRVAAGQFPGPMVFTVIRATRSQATKPRQNPPPVGGLICCHVPVESQVFVPQRANAVNEVPVNLPVKNTVEVINGEPIEIVDYLAISVLESNGSNSVPMAAGGTGQTSYIAPAIRAGQERLSDGTVAFNNRLLVNGEANPAGGGGGGGGPAVVTTVDAFELALARFRAAARGGSTRAASNAVPFVSRAKIGTKVNYRLNQAGAVKFTVQRRRAGRRVRGKCRKQMRKNRRRKRCDLALKGSFTHRGNPGLNSFKFTGRLRRRKIKPGRYYLVAKPVGANTKAKRAKFTIVKR